MVQYWQQHGERCGNVVVVRLVALLRMMVNCCGNRTIMATTPQREWLQHIGIIGITIARDKKHLILLCLLINHCIARCGEQV